MSAFSDRLIEFRKKKHLSRQQVVDLMDLPYSTVATWEYGKSEPGQESLLKLAEIYGVSVDELLGIEKDPTPEDDEPLIEYEVLYDFLVRSGIIEEGEQLSKADARFVAAIVDLLVEWSNLRKA